MKEMVAEMSKITSKELVDVIYGPEKPSSALVSTEFYCSPERPRFYERMTEGRVEPDNDEKTDRSRKSGLRGR